MFVPLRVKLSSLNISFRRSKLLCHNYSVFSAGQLRLFLSFYFLATTSSVNSFRSTYYSVHRSTSSDGPSSCEPDVQKLVSTLTFEDLITGDKGVTAARSLVNVIINQQIGQQISVGLVDVVACNDAHCRAG